MSLLYANTATKPYPLTAYGHLNHIKNLKEHILVMMKFNQSDHQWLWIEVTFHSRFGHDLPAIVRPPMRRLTGEDPSAVSAINKI